jgi:predicted nucleotidyltransferase
MTDPNRETLVRTADALGQLIDEFVFVGGSVAGLLITSPGNKPRPTEDVDVIVKAATRRDYEQMTNRMQAIGFKPDQNGPICRYIKDGLMIDIMPLDETILGFTNPWYRTAMTEFEHIKLSDATSIRVVTAPVFMATKLEAFHNRGEHDPFLSHDLEDILVLLEGRRELLDDIMVTPLNVREYLGREFSDLRNQSYFDDVLAGTFNNPQQRAMVRQRIEIIIQKSTEL